MVSVVKRRGATAIASVLLAAGTITVPTAAEAASASPPGTAALSPANPAVLPTQIIIKRNVTFSGGVPVGGSFTLRIYPSGSYSYYGHMHDSGATSYNFASVCVVRFGGGTAFAFYTTGRMHGTFEQGSRDHDWFRDGRRQSIRDAWSASGGGSNWSCRSSVRTDVRTLVNSAIQDVGYTVSVTGIAA